MLSTNHSHFDFLTEVNGKEVLWLLRKAELTWYTDGSKTKILELVCAAMA
jgi:hypothetical protein